MSDVIYERPLIRFFTLITLTEIELFGLFDSLQQIENLANANYPFSF